MDKVNILYIYTIFLIVKLANSVELTFELPDNARECFYEEIKQNTSATLEFQVIKLIIFYVKNLVFCKNELRVSFYGCAMIPLLTYIFDI